MSISSPALISAHDLAAERGGRRLFADVEFTLRPGELLQVAGANGSGKTTLLRILAGLATPAQGEVRLAGQPVRAVRGSIAWLGHAPAVSGALTPGEHLHLHARLSGGTDGTGALESALARVGLLAAAEIPCRRLSAGQQRRVALARLLLSDAPLWILDEPLTALDRAGVELVEQLLEEHLARGGGAVLTTHQPLSRTVHARLELQEAPWTL